MGKPLHFNLKIRNAMGLPARFSKVMTTKYLCVDVCCVFTHPVCSIANFKLQCKKISIAGSICTEELFIRWMNEARCFPNFVNPFTPELKKYILPTFQR